MNCLELALIHRSRLIFKKLLELGGDANSGFGKNNLNFIQHLLFETSVKK